MLPSNVDIAKFIANPSDFKSLNNLFILCNREKVKEEFEMAIKQDGDYENLLEQVSKTVTSTFRGIWADFKDTSIQLRPNGSEISIKVANKAKYTFEDRSDGFKKFISVLLMISTKARSNMIGERDIILIDEPDQSLYPTSARFLKEELLKISEKAKLIYSTHSQYMIDSTCIDRHIIVEKKNDITTAKREDRNASFSNDELLRQAVGSSIFECLKDINLIFEGWLDKELFIKYCEYSNKTKDYSNIGIVYLGGISGVETLVQLLILANKKFIIVSDADETSKKKKIDFVNNYKEYAKSWLSYAEIDSDITTMEDFIISSHIENQLKTISPDFIYDSSKNAISNIETAVNKEKELKQKVKNDIITTLDKNHIKPCYDKYLEKLNELKTMI